MSSYTLQQARRVLSDGGGNAELLVYLVDEEKDIYIGVRRFATYGPVGRILSAA